MSSFRRRTVTWSPAPVDDAHAQAGRLVRQLRLELIDRQRLASREALDCDDPRLAAAHFNWLVMSIPLNQAMLLGEDEPATTSELDRYAAAGVRAFLAAYRKR